MAMTTEHILNACEEAFQAGGPRTYIVDVAKWRIRPTTSAKAGLAHAYDEETVWSRRKVRGERRYEWQCMTKAPKVQGVADTLKTALADRRHFAPDNMAENELLDAIIRVNELVDALKAATAFVELYTPNGVQEQPPVWATNFNAVNIADHARKVLAKAEGNQS